MRFVKLDAIDSTNDFLKRLSQAESVENFTVVSAKSQTRGKGQMGAVWTSEPGKNLTMSVLVRDANADVSSIFKRNAAVAIAITDVLHPMGIPGLSVKWPNDIMSGNRKIGGILIENSLRNEGGIEAVIGVGLNVNQNDFRGLPQASSLHLVTGNTFDVDDLVADIAQSIQRNLAKTDTAWERYLESLFRRNVPTAFEDARGNRFMGIIHTVNPDGKLKVQLEDDSFQTFGIKEIKMLY